MAMLNNQMVYIYIGASLHSQTHPLCFSPSPAAQKPLRCRLPTSHAPWLGRENGREASAGRRRPGGWEKLPTNMVNAT